MIKKTLVPFILIHLCCSLQAQEIKDFDIDDLELSERTRKSDTISYRDQQTGLMQENYSLDDDKYRLSFLYHFNRDFASLSDLQTIEAQYSFKVDSIWVELYALRLSALYSEIFDTTSVSIDQGESNDSISAFGLGVSYQGKWIQELINNKRLFTTTFAGLGYYNYSNEFTGQSFTGVGLKTDFGLHIRQSTKFHYGLKMSYHLAPMTREAAFEGEPSSARSLTASWLSFGFDFSIYF